MFSLLFGFGVSTPVYSAMYYREFGGYGKGVHENHPPGEDEYLSLHETV
jgi:hypothetical protein